MKRISIHIIAAFYRKDIKPQYFRPVSNVHKSEKHIRRGYKSSCCCSQCKNSLMKNAWILFDLIYLIQKMQFQIQKLYLNEEIHLNYFI